MLVANHRRHDSGKHDVVIDFIHTERRNNGRDADDHERQLLLDHDVEVDLDAMRRCARGADECRRNSDRHDVGEHYMDSVSRRDFV